MLVKSNGLHLLHLLHLLPLQLIIFCNHGDLLHRPFLICDWTQVYMVHIFMMLGMPL